MSDPAPIAVVIPCWNVRKHILGVLSAIGPEVESIYVVDDECPEHTADLVHKECRDRRVKVLRHDRNKGVGGAVMTGYKAALQDGANIVVKVDGDGQIDPALIPELIQPIVQGRADYVKGNRFYTLDLLSGMPAVRVIGNSIVSFVSKLASGYWNIMDPTNGLTAIHVKALRAIPLEKVDERYFFESDMLFRLSIIRAVVAELPMNARYADEKSGIKLGRVCREFPLKYLHRFAKRVFYMYFLRDFNIYSLEIVAGVLFLAFGLSFGSYQWLKSVTAGVYASSGTVMLAALPVILGVQFLLAALSFDVMNVPKSPFSRLGGRRESSNIFV